MKLMQTMNKPGPCNQGCSNWTQPISACVVAGCDLIQVKRNYAKQEAADRFVKIAMQRCKDAVEQAILETAREFVEGNNAR